MSNPVIKFDKVTTSSNAVPTALQGSVYWYDTGTTYLDSPVYYDSSNTYALWSFSATEHIISIKSEVGGPNDVFQKVDSISGTYTGYEEWEGTLSLSEYTISEAWNLAESTVFDSFKAFNGNTEDVDCFRGYLPINEDGLLKAANRWMITSGGTAGAFDVSRTYGTSGSWCSELIPASIMGVFENRTSAMQFAGNIQAWLKHTQNLNKTVNVNWCHLAELPDAPVERIQGNHRFWEITVQLEILFLTESVYS